jgi:hypothetical protein
MKSSFYKKQRYEKFTNDLVTLIIFWQNYIKNSLFYLHKRALIKTCMKKNKMTIVLQINKIKD